MLGGLVGDAITGDWAVVSPGETFTSPLSWATLRCKPEHPRYYCFVYMDSLNRVQLEEWTGFVVCFLIADDLSQQAVSSCLSSQSKIWSCMFNLYFAEPCKYICKLRALSWKHGVPQGFSRLSVAALRKLPWLPQSSLSLGTIQGRKWSVLRHIPLNCSVRTLFSQSSPSSMQK